jgi:hypothetical protein
VPFTGELSEEAIKCRASFMPDYFTVLVIKFPFLSSAENAMILVYILHNKENTSCCGITADSRSAVAISVAQL